MIDFLQLGFEDVLRIDEFEGVPRRGLALFRDVPYAFTPDPQPIQGEPKGVSCHLNPIEPNSGLSMRAVGFFRSAPESATNFQVRWVSFGSPGLTTHPRLRELFAEFLERLAAQTATAAHWDGFLVEHYPDHLVAEVRHECVQLLYHNQDPLIPLPSQQTILRQWAQRLRHAT